MVKQTELPGSPTTDDSRNPQHHRIATFSGNSLVIVGKNIQDLTIHRNLQRSTLEDTEHMVDITDAASTK